MNKFYLLGLMLILSISITSAAFETANISTGTTSSFVQSTTKGMIFNITNATAYTYRIMNVTKDPSTTATTVRLCSDIACSSLLTTATFVGDVATFSGGYIINKGVEYYILTESTSITHRVGVFSGYPAPAVNSFVKFTGSVNDGAKDTNNLVDFNSVTIAYDTDIRYLNAELLTPTTGSFVTAAFTNFTANFSSFGYNMTNVTFYIWNSTGLFNQTTRTVTGNNTNSSRLEVNSFVLGTYTWNAYICGRNSTGANYYCNFAPNNYTFIIGLSNILTNYNSNVYPTASENFTLNFTSNNILSSAYLIYNGTSYATTISSSSNNYSIFNTLSIPTYPSYPSNVSFYWNLFFTNSTLNTSNYYQLVSNLTLATISSGACSAGLTQSMYFNFADEQNLTTQSASIFNYNFIYGFSGNNSGFVLAGNLSNVNNVSICINNSNSYYSLGYGEIQYTIAGDTPRRYYIFSNTRLTNITINNTLYGLSTSSSTTFQETVTDNDLNIYQGVYTTLLRWYPSLNQYKVVEMSKTDDKGQSIFSVETQTVDYRIGVYAPDGTLYQILNATRFVCTATPCTYSVFVTANAPDYTSFYGVQQSMTYNNNTHIVTYTWNDPSQTTSSMNLTVMRIDTNPAQLICSTVASGWSGILICDTTGTSGTIRANAYRSASPASFIYSIIFETERGLSAIAGGKSVGLIMMFFFGTLGALIGVFSPVAALALGILSLIPMMMLGVINLSVVIGFAILGGIIFHFIRKS